MTDVRGRRRWGRNAACIFLLALLALHFSLNLQRNAKIFLDTDAYVSGEATAPYQYRLLMAPVLGALINAASQPQAASILKKLPGFIATPEAASYAALNGASFFVAILLHLAIVKRIWNDSRLTLIAGTSFAGLSYVVHALNPNLAFILPYDLPALVFSQACILFLIDRRWACLVTAFVLATLNRETSLLICVLLVVLTLFRSPLRAKGWLIAVLVVLWIAVKVALYARFSHLPSDEGLRISYNFLTLAKPWQWPALMPLMCCVGLCVYASKIDAEVRPWAVVATIGFSLLFVVAQITETRAFSELIPYFSISMAALAARRLGFRNDPPC